MRSRAEDIRATYRRQAAAFDAARSKSLFERKWLDAFLHLVPANGRIADIGCGTGDPVARYLSAKGYTVTGVDFSPEMLAIARENQPDGDWRLADMRDLALGERYGGVLAWNSFFHLTREEQRRTLPRLLDHVGEGGAFMTTVGPSAGEAWGEVGGERVHHASLHPGEYERILDEHGFDIAAFVKEDPDCAGHTVLLARR